MHTSFKGNYILSAVHSSFCRVLATLHSIPVKFHAHQPLVLYFQRDVWVGLASLVFGVLSLVSGSLVFLLPETKAKGLPETMAEADALDNRYLDTFHDTYVREIVGKKVKTKIKVQ